MEKTFTAIFGFLIGITLLGQFLFWEISAFTGGIEVFGNVALGAIIGFVFGLINLMLLYIQILRGKRNIEFNAMKAEVEELRKLKH